MAALLDFYINTASDFNLKVSGSGLGFFGSSFTDPIAVGAYNTKTYCTDGNGLVQGAEAQNVKWSHPSSGILGAGASVNLLNVPNYQASVSVRFTNDTAVKVQNVRAYVYDRSNINNAASGVTAKLAEIIHTSPLQGVTGSGDSIWTTFNNSTGGTYLTLANSPGLSGLYAGNGTDSTRTDTRHDWYLAISASPDSVGSKSSFGLYFMCEFL